MVMGLQANLRRGPESDCTSSTTASNPETGGVVYPILSGPSPSCVVWHWSRARNGCMSVDVRDRVHSSAHFRLYTAELRAVIRVQSDNGVLKMRGCCGWGWWCGYWWGSALGWLNNTFRWLLTSVLIACGLCEFECFTGARNTLERLLDQAQVWAPVPPPPFGVIWAAYPNG